MKIYLAGGMRSGWMEKVLKLVEQHEYYIPSDKIKPDGWDVNIYGAWDLHHIRRCDLVFAYMEKDNPSGIGMSVEIGYAYGIGKTVILVLEKNNKYQKDIYLDFQKKCSHLTFDNFSDGVNFLKTLKI